MSNFPEIIIIVGSGRSGTSYLQRTLRDTLDIGFFREPDYIVPIYRHLYHFGDLNIEENLQKLVKHILADRIFVHLSKAKNIANIYEELFPRISNPTYSAILYAIFEYVAEKLGKHRLGYKFPADITNLSELAKIFPTARFVHMLRDGRDVAISLLNQQWGPMNLYAGSRFWGNRTIQGHEAGITLPDRYIETRFEDLILRTEDAATNLGEFLNRGKDMQQVDSLIDQINRTKNTSAVYGWRTKLDDSQVYVCESAAGPTLMAYGYPLKFNGAAKLSPMKSWLYLSSDVTSRAIRKLRTRLTMGLTF